MMWAQKSKKIEKSQDTGKNDKINDQINDRNQNFARFYTKKVLTIAKNHARHQIFYLKFCNRENFFSVES